MLMLDFGLSPAQILFLQTPSKVKTDDIFRIILRELIIKGVVRLSITDEFPTKRSKKIQKYYRFIKGYAFDTYEPLVFEKSFLYPLEDGEHVQVKVLTNYVLRKYSMPSDFVTKKIYIPLSKDKFISSLPILKTFGYYSIKRKSKQLLIEVDEFINQQEEVLSSLIDGDQAEFISAMNDTGTFVFLFETRNPDLYNNIIRMMKEVYNNQPLGADNDLTNFMEAFNVDMSYMAEH